MTPRRNQKLTTRERLSATWRLWAPPLRWRANATRRLWRPAAGDQMSYLAVPDPFPDGVIDFPRPEAELAREPLTINGWALFPEDAVSHIDVWLDDELLGRARLGIPRPDLALLRGQPRAEVAGFELTADLKDWGGHDGAATLRVVATSTAGETHELEMVEIEIGPRRRQKTEKRMEPPAARTPHADGNRARRVLVYTHQLNLGGAQLYLQDLLSELVKSEAIEPTVVSAIDGRLREDLEELGIPVHISSPLMVDNVSSHIGRVEELTSWAADRGFEAVFINTATALALPGAEVAAQLGIPAIWAIHESFPPAVLWSGMSTELRERAERTLSGATLAIFEAEATQRIYDPLLKPSQCVTLPYGLDLGPIEAERAEFSMGAARRKVTIPKKADVLLCVGTVEPRKAQIPLAQAFDLIADRHPDAHLVIVGAGSNADSTALANWIEDADWGNRLRLIPVTPDIHSWYALADLLVCASDVESLPRTVLEAMAFETPVLATDVFGLPELIDHGKTGWLCEPRDINALAAALDQFLGTPEEERREVAQAARELVEQRHHLPEYANRVATLLSEAVDGPLLPESGHVAAP